MDDRLVDPLEGVPFPDQQTAEMLALYNQQVAGDSLSEDDVEQAEFHLTAQEINSPLMRKLMAHFDERLFSLRMQNDYPISEVDTCVIRGKIALVKEFLSLGKIPDSDSDTDDHEDMHVY